MEHVNSLKLPLFKFRTSLDIEQADLIRITDRYMTLCESYSELEVFTGLRNELYKYSYDPSATQIIESLQNEITKYNLSYQLKDLYAKMARENYTGTYNKPLDVVMKIVMTPDDNAKYECIVNELKTYDWVPQIAGFINQVLQGRQIGLSRHDHLTGGRASKVYSIAEKCNEGTISFIKDNWFLFTANQIKPIRLGDFVGGDTLSRLLRLQEAIKSAEIDDKTISFQISDDINLGISLDESLLGKLYINTELVSEHTELQHIFNMPAVNFIQREFYPIVLETYNSLNKFIELDVCVKVENPSYPHLETYAFHYGDKAYLYRCNSKMTNQFFEYDSVSELLEDVRKDSGFDLSYFYDSKLGEETKKRIALEDQEAMLDIELTENLNAMAVLESQSEMLMKSESLTELYDTLQINKIELEKKINSVRSQKIALVRPY
jgi:hypothetical protein